MIKSMTGYGKGQASIGNLSLSIEIKTVNHRYGDIAIKCGKNFLFLENEIKKTVSARLKRGRIDVFISQETAGGSSAVPVIDQPLAEAYMNSLEELRRRFAFKDEIPLAMLAAQKDVLTVRDLDLPEEEGQSCLMQALQTALEAVEVMRAKEGEATRLDMAERLALVEKMLAQIVSRAPQVPVEWQARLKERLAALGDGIEVEPQRVAQEITVFADRCDISEEITRFRSHIDQFRSLFEAEEPIGRKMDFLTQELNREVNTMGSKSNDIELTRCVVEIKAELEKIREQVQNIE